MVGFLLVVALVAIAFLLMQNSKIKSELKSKSFSASCDLKALNNSIDSKVKDIQELKSQKEALKKGYEREIVIYQKAVKDGISFTAAKMQIEEYERVAAQQEEMKRVIVEQYKRNADANRQSERDMSSRSSSRSGRSSRDSKSSSSNTRWDDFNGGYSGSDSSSSSSSSSGSSSSYSGGGGDFGGGGSGGSWSD